MTSSPYLRGPMGHASRHSLALLLIAVGMIVGCSAKDGSGGNVGRGSADSVTSHRGQIVSATLMGGRTAHQVALALQENGLAVRDTNGVELYRIIYRTVDPWGRETRASGTLALPVLPGRALPLLGYQHGTVVNRSAVASAYGFDVESVLFGGTGYVVAAADYLGLGESPGMHPYVHAASLATAVIDMLHAARAFCRGHGVQLDGRLFLAGYSEGGYATMAAHRAIEEGGGGDLAVTASAPMAGPYDMSGVMRSLLIRRDIYSEPFFLPYVLLAYDSIYHLAPSLSAMLRSPYDTLLPRLFDGTHEGFEINRSLPSRPADIFRPDYLARFIADSSHPLRRALLENDLDRWSPRAPMRLYHCIDDDLVPYENSRVAHESFLRLGARQVELVTLRNGGHIACFMPALVRGKEWFDSLGRGARP